MINNCTGIHSHSQAKMKQNVTFQKQSPSLQVNNQQQQAKDTVSFGGLGSLTSRLMPTKTDKPVNLPYSVGEQVTKLVQDAFSALKRTGQEANNAEKLSEIDGAPQEDIVKAYEERLTAMSNQSALPLLRDLAGDVLKAAKGEVALDKEGFDKTMDAIKKKGECKHANLRPSETVKKELAFMLTLSKNEDALTPETIKNAAKIIGTAKDKLLSEVANSAQEQKNEIYLSLNTLYGSPENCRVMHDHLDGVKKKVEELREEMTPPLPPGLGFITG